MRHPDKAQAYEMSNTTILQIKDISRHRTHLLSELTGWKVRLEEQKAFSLTKVNTKAQSIFARHVKRTEAAIKELDELLEELICNEEQTKAIYDIALSAPGFGKKNTIIIIAETEIFTKTKNARLCQLCRSMPLQIRKWY